MFFNQPDLFNKINLPEYQSIYEDIAQRNYDDLVIYKAQLYKQLYNDIKQGGGNVDELCGFINFRSSSNKQDKKNVNSKDIKKKKKTGGGGGVQQQNKKSKNAKQRKNSDNIAIEKFFKNINNHSVPKDKVVKVKNIFLDDWINNIEESNKNINNKS